MTTVVVGEIGPEQFALKHTFQTLPELTIDAEPAVDHGNTIAMPLLWTRGVDEETVTSTLQDDPSTDGVTLLADMDDKQLYRIRWTERVRDMLEVMLSNGATLLDVSADARSWRFQVLYPNRADVSLTNGHDLDVEIGRVGELETESTVRYGLTDKQHEALHTGWVRGYFDVPRRIGIKELSSDLGITHQAASERIRRGQSSLIKEAFGLHGRG